MFGFGEEVDTHLHSVLVFLHHSRQLAVPSRGILRRRYDALRREQRRQITRENTHAHAAARRQRAEAGVSRWLVTVGFYILSTPGCARTAEAGRTRDRTPNEITKKQRTSVAKKHAS